MSIFRLVMTYIGLALPSVLLASDWAALGDIGAPSWVTQADWTRQSTQDKLALQQHGNTVTIIEHVPKGQTDQNWRKRHIMAHFPNVKKSPAKAMRVALNRMAKDCATKGKYQEEKHRKSGALLYFECGKHKEDGLGRMAVMIFGKTSDGALVRVSEEWRGPSYDVKASGDRFFTPKDVRKIIKTLASTRLD